MPSCTTATSNLKEHCHGNHNAVWRPFLICGMCQDREWTFLESVLGDYNLWLTLGCAPDSSDQAMGTASGCLGSMDPQLKACHPTACTAHQVPLAPLNIT